MSIYNLKPWFRSKLSTITHSLWKRGITPNQVTVCAIVLSVVYGLAMPYADILFLLFPLFVIFRMALNAIDGLMATTYSMQSKFGMFLNEAGDIVSDIFLILPFALFVPWYLFYPFLILAIITELVGIVQLFIRGERRYDGPMGKSDRVFALSIISLFVWFNGSVPYMTAVFILFNLMLCKTIYNRKAK